MAELFLSMKQEEFVQQVILRTGEDRSSNDTSISIQHLSKTFKGKKNGVVQALDDLTLEVQSVKYSGFSARTVPARAQRLKSSWG